MFVQQNAEEIISEYFNNSEIGNFSASFFQKFYAHRLNYHSPSMSVIINISLMLKAHKTLVRSICQRANNLFEKLVKSYEER